jgi:hypothetical protein
VRTPRNIGAVSGSPGGADGILNRYSIVHNQCTIIVGPRRGRSWRACHAPFGAARERRAMRSANEG